jgi:DNA-binding winged helix-turn-helix (wHTH) protein
VLLYLAEHRDRTVARRELLDAIWPASWWATRP